MDMLTDMLAPQKAYSCFRKWEKSSPGWSLTYFFKSILWRYSLFFFSFFCFFDSCFFYLFAWCFTKSKMDILVHIWIYGRVSDKKNFTRLISGNKTTVFCLNTLFLIDTINICELRYLEFDSFIHRKIKRKECNNCLEHCS